MKKKFFIVDDDEVIVSIITKSFQEKFDVVGFENAEDCLKEMESTAPDILIIDYFLPGKNGLELFNEIEGKFPDTKIILLSNNDNGNLVLDMIKRGVRDYVIKDDDFVEAIEAIVEDDSDLYFDVD